MSEQPSARVIPVAPIEYLELDTVVGLCRVQGWTIADIGLIASAVGRPATTVMGMDAYPTLAEKAASLMHSIACNHALVDGNKRLALLATVHFLDLNGATLDMTNMEAAAVVIGIADGSLREVKEIATRLRISAL